MSSDMQGEELAAILRANIRARRNELGLTQKQLAERLNATQPFVAQLEAGKCVPSLQYLAVLAEQLNTNPAALLTRDIFSHVHA